MSMFMIYISFEYWILTLNMKLAGGLIHSVWVLSDTLEAAAVIMQGLTDHQRTPVTFKQKLDVWRLLHWLLILQPDHL